MDVILYFTKVEMDKSERDEAYNDGNENNENSIAEHGTDNEWLVDADSDQLIAAARREMYGILLSLFLLSSVFLSSLFVKIFTIKSQLCFYKLTA